MKNKPKVKLKVNKCGEFKLSRCKIDNIQTLSMIKTKSIYNAVQST